MPAVVNDKLQFTFNDPDENEIFFLLSKRCNILLHKTSLQIPNDVDLYRQEYFATFQRIKNHDIENLQKFI